MVRCLGWRRCVKSYLKNEDKESLIGLKGIDNGLEEVIEWLKHLYAYRYAPREADYSINNSQPSQNWHLNASRLLFWG